MNILNNIKNIVATNKIKALLNDLARINLSNEKVVSIFNEIKPKERTYSGITYLMIPITALPDLLEVDCNQFMKKAKAGKIDGVIFKITPRSGEYIGVKRII